MSTTTEKSMSMREFLTKVTAIENAPADVVAFAESQIEKLSAKNSSRSVKVAKKFAAENAPLMEQIREVLAANPSGMIASEIAAATGLTTAKVSALGKKMVENGMVTSEKVKVPKVGERVKFTIA